ncbi:MAG: PHP domain-containing protein [Candidatus Latescibacterota bacterium]
MRYNLADLHIHTMCSDGLRTPSQAVAEARDAGLQAISVTDHDTVEGQEEAIAEGERLGVEVVPGTELSAHVREREVHLLGYCVDWRSPELTGRLDQVHQRRHERGIAIVRRLNNLGLGVTLEEVLDQAKGSPLGRPHIAAAMVDRGLVASKDEAFTRYLGDRGPAFSPKPYTSAADTIALIHRAGGVAVLAHPGVSFPELVVAQLVSWGMDGIEVFHPAHQPPQIDYYMQLAGRYDLLITGGSDSHGDAEGTRVGEYGIGCEAIGAMRRRASAYA